MTQGPRTPSPLRYIFFPKISYMVQSDEIIQQPKANLNAVILSKNFKLM